jgi:hypothetical protein
MNIAEVYSLRLILFCVAIGCAHGGQCAVLGNIDCGNGQPSCFSVQASLYGSATCTCKATCLSPSSLLSKVGAGAGLTWTGCQSPIGVTVQGGTRSGGSTVSTVYVDITVVGPWFNGTRENAQDCFLGQVSEDPPIKKPC